MSHLELALLLCGFAPSLARDAQRFGLDALPLARDASLCSASSRISAAARILSAA